MEQVEQDNPYRAIPSIDALLQDQAVMRLLSSWPIAQLSASLREATQQLRREIAAGGALPGSVAEDLAKKSELLLLRQNRPRLQRVVNATGVVLHTNLGRAPLSSRAISRVVETCGGYSNLELDLATGQRGSRHLHIDEILVQLCAGNGHRVAETKSQQSLSAVVVNNCAAAMMLIVDEFARGREVIVSRGELVEIGGGFRVPDVLERGGAKLVEVGCTNRTRIKDFETAINERTSMLLSTHLSNFTQSGFVESPTPLELVKLGRSRGVISCLDLGSGLLCSDLDFPEVSVQNSVQQGFDLIAFSGDKLLGGPQAGIILGKPELIARLKKNPLMRALRVDKLILAALEGTLLSYLDQDSFKRTVPVLEMLHRDLSSIRSMAEQLAADISTLLRPLAVEAEIVAGTSSTGGGSLPGFEIDTWNVRVPVNQEELWAGFLREADPPVLVRRQSGALLLDPRTLNLSEVPLVVAAFNTALQRVLAGS